MEKFFHFYKWGMLLGKIGTFRDNLSGFIPVGLKRAVADFLRRIGRGSKRKRDIRGTSGIYLKNHRILLGEMLGGDTISPAKIRWFGRIMMDCLLYINNKFSKSQGYFIFVTKKLVCKIDSFCNHKIDLDFLLRFWSKKTIFIG